MNGLLNDNDSSFLRCQAQGNIEYVVEQMCRPSVLYRPQLVADGDMWCAIYRSVETDDLQTGLAAFGATPEEAMQNFDIAWRTQKAGGQQ